MEAKVSESKFGIFITLKPETKEEILTLLRYSNNVKKEKPHVHFSFQNEPYCSISLKKKAESVQKNSITSY